MKLLKILTYFIALFAIASGGCDEETFEKPENLIIDLAVADCSEYGAADGLVNSNILGGAPPYQYVWSNGATTESIQNLTAGQYTLKVIYAGSGVAEATVFVAEPDGALSVDAQVADASWYGGDDGSIRLLVSDGIAPYSYVWAHNREETASLVQGLTSGIYSVTITDSGPKPITVTKSIPVGQPEFVCGLDSITDVDGNKYPTVRIGDQCWTATNLITRHNPDNPEELIDGRFCKGTNCLNEMGAHYTWEGVMNGAESSNGDNIVQGICPKGWHIPTRDNWKDFNAYLSLDGNGGPGVNVPNKIRGADSPSGFNALYAGNWGYDVFTGELAAFWSSTLNENQEGRAYYRLVNNFPILGEGHEDTRIGLSCRCIQD